MSIVIRSTVEGNLTRQDKELLHDIMREAYAETEIEIWGENYVRMDREEYFDLIYQGSILYATIDGEICGSVYYYPINPTVYGFSLLCARKEFRHRGIGKALVAAVEQRAKKEGASSIHIDILRPRDFETTNKAVLRRWYQSLGYTYSTSGDFADFRPEKARLLKVPSNFDSYEKVLVG